MNDFGFYFSMGWQHMISWDALDHLLFIAALSSIYLLQNWKQVLVLVTAFTIGHSLTLVASVYNLLRVSDRWVEFLIPCTIVATAALNFRVNNYEQQSLRFNYWPALFFGLVHGLGYANTLRFMLAKDQGIGWPLMSFNLGLEAGQLLVVLLIMGLASLLIGQLHLQRKYWVYSVSMLCLLTALAIAVTRWPL